VQVRDYAGSASGFHIALFTLGCVLRQTRDSEMLYGKQMSACLCDIIFPVSYILHNRSACLTRLLFVFLTHQLPNTINVLCCFFWRGQDSTKRAALWCVMYKKTSVRIGHLKAQSLILRRKGQSTLHFLNI